MRTLVIAGEYPWPANSGSRHRLLTVLAGLRRCGPVELFSAVPRARTDFDPPDCRLGLSRVGRVGFDDRPPSGWRILPRLADASTPIGLHRSDGAALAALARFASGRYDLVWYFGIRPYVLVGGLEGAPSVLDLDDLEDQKINARLGIERPPADSPVLRARRAAALAFSREEIRRWRRLYRGAGGQVAAVVVCSELDAARAAAAGLPRVAVVRNGYRFVERPLGQVEVADPPTFLFQGTLRYPPNADGARYLAVEVAPRLRAAIPGARVRLVGRTTPELTGLDDPPRLHLVGQVDDIDAELARADAVVVPVRFGSGTRVKVLEAFAHRIPVASTTLGAEGLGAEDGVHLLVGDTPDALAAACARLGRDETLRRTLVENAHRLFVDRFRQERVEEQVIAVAERALG